MKTNKATKTTATPSAAQRSSATTAKKRLANVSAKPAPKPAPKPEPKPEPVAAFSTFTNGHEKPVDGAAKKRVKAAKAAGLEPCSKCGRHNTSGRDCKTTAACKRRRTEAAK